MEQIYQNLHAKGANPHSFSDLAVSSDFSDFAAFIQTPSRHGRGGHGRGGHGRGGHSYFNQTSQEILLASSSVHKLIEKILVCKQMEAQTVQASAPH